MQTGGAATPTIGDITADELVEEPELAAEPEEITDKDLPTDTYPPVPADEPAAAEEQAPTELTNESINTTLVDTRRAFEGVLGKKEDNFAKWAELGRRIGIDDERVQKESPEIKETWDKLGETARGIIQFLDEIGKTTSQVIGGIKSPQVPPLELSTGPIPKPSNVTPIGAGKKPELLAASLQRKKTLI
jgi:hypothetical protein